MNGKDCWSHHTCTAQKPESKGCVNKGFAIDHVVYSPSWSSSHYWYHHMPTPSIQLPDPRECQELYRAWRKRKAFPTLSALWFRQHYLCVSSALGFAWEHVECQCQGAEQGQWGWQEQMRLWSWGVFPPCNRETHWTCEQTSSQSSTLHIASQVGWAPSFDNWNTGQWCRWQGGPW